MVFIPPCMHSKRHASGRFPPRDDHAVLYAMRKACGSSGTGRSFIPPC